MRCLTLRLSSWACALASLRRCCLGWAGAGASAMMGTTRAKPGEVRLDGGRTNLRRQWARHVLRQQSCDAGSCKTFTNPKGRRPESEICACTCIKNNKHNIASKNNHMDKKQEDGTRRRRSKQHVESCTRGRPLPTGFL